MGANSPALVPNRPGTVGRDRPPTAFATPGRANSLCACLSALCSPEGEVTSAAKAGLPSFGSRTGSALLVAQATSPSFPPPLPCIFSPPPTSLPPRSTENWSRGCPPPDICKLHAHEVTSGTDGLLWGIKGVAWRPQVS